MFPQGRFDRERWKAGWQTLFDTHVMIHSNRSIIRVAVSEEQDGAFAVVDVDTLWRNAESGGQFHWVGRACKGYTRTGNEWKLIFHTGLLHYEEVETRVANGMIMRVLERTPIRMRELGATTSAWRMTVDTPDGRGTITLLDGGFYRGDGVFLGRSQEELAGAYRALAVSDAPAPPDLQQWG